MKPPAEYLSPDPTAPPGYITLSAAQRALEAQAAEAAAALARITAYHQNLARALRNSKAPHSP